ncbi:MULTISPECIES: hypothetical protein [Pseudomonas]|uniref:hypothetical protein n=1 Tax=Pseudomonas TaxID=286 RepID=UPI00086369FD|nr:MULTISPECIES: hypothetical protein [Pseudomonas]MDG9889994.1 hypothetical protein [Pseudomonas juntendi]
MTIQRSDVVSHTQPGGGGFGNPLDRPLSAIEEDVWNHKLSASFVREHYRAVVDPATGKLDEIATRELRAMTN